MRTTVFCLVAGGFALAACGRQPGADIAPGPHPVVVLDTTYGNITLQLDREKAPKTTNNFLRYASEHFYDMTIFHRVINGFMVQGGGFTAGLVEKSTHDPISNESDNGLRNVRGTVAMARTQGRDSATAQFFINVADNPALDYPNNGGYAVFGTVVDGMDVVDRIKAAPTGTERGLPNVPVNPIVIESVQIK